MQSAVLATAIPSVCLSVTRWYCTQTNEDRIMRSSLWGSKNTLVFWYQQWLGGDVPFYLRFVLTVTHPCEKCWLRPVSSYNFSTIRASENSSIITNRKSTVRFPTSYRWSAYVTHKSPKGCFVRHCLQSESILVKSVANYGVRHGGMLSGLGGNVETCCEHFSLSTSMLLGMPPSYLSDVLLRHSMQHYSVEMFSRVLATVEFIMVRCWLLSIAELSLSCSDLARCIFEMCTWYCILCYFFQIFVFFLIFSCFVYPVYELMINE